MSDTRSKQELLPSRHSTCEHTVQKHPSWFLEVIRTGPAHGIASVLIYYFPYCSAGIPFESTSTQGGCSMSDTRSHCVFPPYRCSTFKHAVHNHQPGLHNLGTTCMAYGIQRLAEHHSDTRSGQICISASAPLFHKCCHCLRTLCVYTVASELVRSR